MKVVGEKSLSNIVKIALQIIFVLGIFVIIFLPYLLKLYITYINPFLLYLPALILLYLSGLPALFIVFEFIKLFETLRDNNPFVTKNVTYLKRIAWLSFFIALVYLIGLVFIKSIFAIIMVAVFVVVWLGLYILSELFKQAINYKEENDLTI